MDERVKTDGTGLATTQERTAALRLWLGEHGFDGFLVPHADAHQSEYLPADAERLAWISGFTGSAGAAIVLAERAALFVDGRYTLQAAHEVDEAAFELCHLADDPPWKWLAKALGAAGGTRRIGYDPWLHAKGQLVAYRDAAGAAGFTLAPVPENPIDRLWADRPPPPASQLLVHPLEFAGRSAGDKRADIAATLAEDRDQAVILSAADSIAWLLNIRGADVAHTPLALCFASLEADATVRLFVAADRLSGVVREHLGSAVVVSPPGDLAAYLDELGRDGARVRVSPATAAMWIFERLEAAGATIHEAGDPCLLPKAIKNEVELQGTRDAHIRDGAAMARFLAWLDGQAPGTVDEMGAAARLEALRREGERIEDLSFPTISGAGANGAIVHYRVSRATNARLDDGLYLVDSGAQYHDGTTDVTRTVAIGAVSGAMRHHFTMVLKGHIALSSARFPKGTRGSQLDALARQFLWAEGLDYDHGTGHGVGSYLGVHEGPQRIAKTAGDASLAPGMIVSNEPGYYREGAYGIRIENLLEVVAHPAGGDTQHRFLGFAPLTRVPIDRRLIDPSLLSAAEVAWVDAYHATVRADIGPLLDAADAAWLDAATGPLS